MLEKINDEMELENEFINANQISLVTQGTINKGVVRCSSSNFFINSDVQINKRPSKAVACILKVFPQCFL